MSLPRELPPVGSVVEVLQGRDAGLVAIVIGHMDGRFLLLADGSVRRADKPKKKNVLHVRRLSYIAEDIRMRLQEDGKVTNAQLRYAVRKFLESYLTMANHNEEGGR